MITIVVCVTAGLALSLLAVFSVKIVHQTERGLVETFGKFSREVGAGIHFIIPIIEYIRMVNITEQMVDVVPQTVITKDNLNAIVDAVVYYKVKEPKAAMYNIDNHREQLSSLARTTLRAVIGNMSFTSANEERNKINASLEEILDKETASYGVDVLRVELQKIEAPKEVQHAMNEVVVAERLRIASSEKANAMEIEADGFKRAEIKKAEAIKQSKILQAEGEAESIKLVNESAERFFKGNAVELKRIESMQRAIQDNSKIIITEKGIHPSLFIGSLNGEIK